MGDRDNGVADRKSELALRRQQRLDEKLKDALAFPAAHYVDDHLQIIFEEGCGHSFIIRTNDAKRFIPSPIGGERGWVEAVVCLNNINQVASLAAALVARLNGLVRHANDDLKRTRLIPLVDPVSLVGNPLLD